MFRSDAPRIVGEGVYLQSILQDNSNYSSSCGGGANSLKYPALNLEYPAEVRTDYRCEL